MANDDDNSTNLFVRFKHHVDAAVGTGLQSIFGLPSFVTQNFDPRAIRASSSESSRPYALAASSSPSPYGGRNSSTSGYAGAGTSTSPSSHANDADDDSDSSAAALEATIDYLSDGSIADHQTAWDLFLRHSCYSPVLLQTTLGRGPPRPRDLPANVDASSLTWVDAFEDLLSISSGLPPMDMVTRLQCALVEAEFHAPMGLPVGTARAMLADWRLRSRSLSCAYLPVDDREMGYTSPRTMEEWVKQRTAESRGQEEICAMLSASLGLPVPGMPGLGALIKGLLPAPPVPSPEKREGQEPTKQPLNHVDTLAGLVRGAVGLFDELSRQDAVDQKRERRKDPDSPAVPEAIGAKTEQDLYDSGPSPTRNQPEGEGGGSSGLHVKGSWSTESAFTTTDGNKKTTSVTKRDQSGKTVKTVTEYVDEEGRRHVDTEVTKTDSQGHVTTEKHYSVKGVGQRHEVEEPQQGLGTKSIKDDGSKGEKNGEKSSSKGWFW